MKEILKAMIILFLGVLAISIFVQYVLPLLIVIAMIYIIYLIYKGMTSNKNNNDKIGTEHYAQYQQNYYPQPPQENHYETAQRLKDAFQHLEVDYTQHEANPVTAHKIQELIEKRDIDTERFFDLLNTTRNLIDNIQPNTAIKPNKQKELSLIEVNRAKSSMSVLDNNWRIVRAKINNQR